MSLQYQCLENVIGLTQQQCPCYDPQAFNEDINKSKSGFYISDPEFSIDLNFPSIYADCKENNIYDILKECRENAYKKVIHKLSTIQGIDEKRIATIHIGKKKKNYNHRKNFSNDLGVTFSGITPQNKTIEIQRIYLTVDINQEYEIYIKNKTDNNILYRYNINAGDNKEAFIDVNTSLPLEDKGLAITYTIGYDPKGAKPYNYKFKCGPCGSNAKTEYDNILKYTGGLDINSYKNETYGLLIQAQINCEALPALCDQPDTFWCDTMIGRSIALYLVIESNNILIEKLLNRDHINVLTNLKKDDLIVKQRVNKEEQKEIIQHIEQYIINAKNTCYVCKDTIIKKRSLI